MAAKKKTPSSKAAPKRPAAAKKPAAPARKKPAAPARKQPATKARRTTTKAKAKAPAPAAPAPVEVETPLPVAASVEEPPFSVEEDRFPEGDFAARVPAPEPERARPSVRRGIFFDVENTSRPSDAQRMIEQLQIDRIQAWTDFVAVGNWRVVGSDTARLLSRHGASLVHSAPSPGVRDWSDLRIAVSAGVWMAAARPGDELIIVSDDKAFDAVGDVAASMGVVFSRASFRAGQRPAGGRAAPARAAAAPAAEGGRRPRGGERRPAPAKPRAAAEVRTETPVPRAPVEQRPRRAPARTTPPAPAVPPSEAPQTAPPDELLAVVQELLAGTPKGVSLDAVSNRLKAMGFERPPGSPRLITRLRSFKELDVSPRGFIRAAGAAPQPKTEAAPTPPEAPPAPSAAPSSAAPPAEGASEDSGEETAEGAEGARKRSRRRRGGRGRSKNGGGEAPPSATAENGSGPTFE